MNIPIHHDKISAQDNRLKNIDQIDLLSFPENRHKKVIIKESYNGFRFDYLWSPKNIESKLVFVLFSGDILRKKNKPPVFQRWSWSSFFPGHCLYVSDPTLFLDNSLTLAWYLGTDQYDPLPKIVETVKYISNIMSVDEKNIIFYGSSGGGFTALRTISFMKNQKIVAINPQISLPNYDNKSYQKYLNICRKGIDRKESEISAPEKVNIISLVKSIDKQKIIYVQNILDQHHYDEHYKPFCDAMYVDYTESQNDRFSKILFSDPGGHGKAESQEAFDKAIHIVSA